MRKINNGGCFHVSRNRRERDYDNRLLKRFKEFWRNSPQLSEPQAIAIFSEKENERKRMEKAKMAKKEKEKAEKIRKRNEKNKPLVRGKGKKDKEPRKGRSIRTISGGSVNPR